MARIINYKEPESAFMTVEKDARLIVDKMLKNTRLKRLLYYTSSDAILNRTGKCKDLDDAQTLSLVNNHIRLRPKITVDPDVRAYIVITFDNFTTNLTNPQFRDNVVTFDIICHLEQWDLENGQLRPYRIAAELDEMFNNSKLTGIGETQFLGCNQVILNDEFAGLSLMYSVTHGGEDKNFNQDKHDLISGEDIDKYIEDFNNTYKASDDEEGWTIE